MARAGDVLARLVSDVADDVDASPVTTDPIEVGDIAGEDDVFEIGDA